MTTIMQAQLLIWHIMLTYKYDVNGTFWGECYYNLPEQQICTLSRVITFLIESISSCAEFKILYLHACFGFCSKSEQNMY